MISDEDLPPSWEAVKGEMEKRRYETIGPEGYEDLEAKDELLVREAVAAAWSVFGTTKQSFAFLHDDDIKNGSTHCGSPVYGLVDNNNDIVYKCQNPNCVKEWRTISL